jgi:hypothetical protein
MSDDNIVDFAETLRDIINDKIKECKDLHESHTRIDTDSLMIQIQALEWVQGEIHDLIFNKVTKYCPYNNGNFSSSLTDFL